jgi:propionyl-CoA carboxylase beta chain
MADVSGSEPAPHPHPIEERIEQLEKLREEAKHAGSAAAVERQHQRGKLTARERIEKLLDPGSFVELDMLARHRAHGFGIENNRPLTDGVVTGWGTIDGRRSSSSRRISRSSAARSARCSPRRSTR